MLRRTGTCVSLSTNFKIAHSVRVRRCLEYSRFPCHGVARFSASSRRSDGGGSIKTTNTERLRSSPNRIALTAGLAGLLLISSAWSSQYRRLESRGEEEDEEAGLIDIVDDPRTSYDPFLDAISLRHAEDILKWEEYSHLPQAGSSVLRIDQVKVGSNSVPEDFSQYGQGLEADGELKWIITAVYDGHAGWQTARVLQRHLISYIVNAMRRHLPGGRKTLSELPSDHLDDALTEAFVTLDKDIMDKGAEAVSQPRYFSESVMALEPALAGSCALVSFYNSDTQLLKIACTGDSRAVLGRRDASGKWQALPLSVDQTGHNAEEVARIQKMHPDEPDIFKDGRILGLAPTRAFGDSRWKWSREVQELARKRFHGPKLREPLKTPPYVTAEPVITTTKIEPERGDFLIMASDGLWDELSSEQAVELVGMWLETHDPSQEVPPPDLAETPPLLEAGTAREPNSPARVNPQGMKEYASLGRMRNEDFVVKDDNVATHLARNALGGKDEDRFCGLMSLLPPFSRDFRDDTTVQVIFFGHDPNAISVD